MSSEYRRFSVHRLSGFGRETTTKKLVKKYHYFFSLIQTVVQDTSNENFTKCMPRYNTEPTSQWRSVGPGRGAIASGGSFKAKFLNTVDPSPGVAKVTHSRQNPRF